MSYESGDIVETFENATIEEDSMGKVKLINFVMVVGELELWEGKSIKDGQIRSWWIKSGSLKVEKDMSDNKIENLEWCPRK